MKRLALFTILFFSILSVRAQEVNTKEWVLVHERTATWCPFCGTWGWTMKDRIFDEFADENLIFMAVHHSGNLANPIATEFGNNFNGGGQPIFYMDGVNLTVNSGNIASKIIDIQEVIDFKKNVLTYAGIGIKAILNPSDKSLEVDAKIEFLESVEGGDYYFGLYLLEDVLNNQDGRTGLQLHKNVLRRSLLANVFNNPIKTGAISKGSEFEFKAKATALNASNDKYKVVGVIWTKPVNNYIFFNANIVNVEALSSTDNNTNLTNDFEVFQSESGNLIVDLKNELTNSSNTISVADMSGKIISSVNVTAGTGSKINIHGNFLPGMHVVTLSDGKNVVSKKMVIQ